MDEIVLSQDGNEFAGPVLSINYIRAMLRLTLNCGHVASFPW